MCSIGRPYEALFGGWLFVGKGKEMVGASFG